MIERLSYENNLLAIRLSEPQSVHGFCPQPRLQKVLKIFFAKQIEPIAGDATQQSIKEPSGSSSSREVCDGPKQRHQRHSGAAPPAFGKALRVPSKESDLAKRTQLQKRTLHAPIHRRARGNARQNALFAWRSL